MDIFSYEQKTHITNSTYGTTLASSNTIKSMVHTLSQKITTWYCMDTFPEENLAFLVGLKSSQMESAAKFVRDALGGSDEHIGHIQF